MDNPYKDPEFPYLYEILDKDEMIANLRRFDVVDGLLIRTYPEDYMKCDAVSCFYSEPQRMYAAVADKPSPMHIWNHGPATPEFQRLAKKYNIASTASPREIYKKLPRHIKTEYYAKLRDEFYPFEANLFNPTISLHLIKKFNIKTILDPTAGWGDRLIAALIAGVEEYTGFDTNEKLKYSYDAIIADLGGNDDRGGHVRGSDRIIDMKIMPFEHAELKDHYYDAVLTSPPFWTIEIYEGPETSTALYKTYDTWIEYFYTPFIKKSYNAVKPGGYIMLYITHEMFLIADRILSTLGVDEVKPLGFAQNTPKKIRMTYIWKLQ